MKKAVSSIKRYIKKGDLVQSIETTIDLCENQDSLSVFLFELIHLSGRYQDLLKSRDAYEPSDFIVFQNRISYSLLSVLERIEDFSLGKGKGENSILNRRALKPSPYFVGRSGEIEKVLGEIRDFSLIQIYGISGIGKSQFVAKILDSFHKNEFDVEWITITGPTSIEDLIHLLGFGGMMVDANLSRREIGNYLIDKIDRKKSIYVLDDFHKISDQTSIKFIIEASQYLAASKFIVISQRMYELGLYCYNHEVEGLGEDGISLLKSFLERQNQEFDLSDFKKVDSIDLFGGHPLSIELFATFLSHRSLIEKEESIKKLVSHYKNLNSHDLLEKILGPDLKEFGVKPLLRVLAISRKPINADILFDILGENYDEETLHYLVYKRYVTVNRGMFSIHSIIKGFLLRTIDDNNRFNCHKNIATALSKLRVKNNLDAELELEIVFHLESLEDNKYLERLINDQALNYLSYGYSSQLDKLIEESNYVKVNADHYHLTKARVLRWKTQYKLAFNHYDKCINGKNEYYRIDALIDSAMLHYQLRDNGEAFYNLHAAYVLARSISYLGGLARVFNMLAILLKDLPAFYNKKDHAIKIGLQISLVAVKISKSIGSEFSLPSYYNTRGRIFQSIQKYDEAIKQFQLAKVTAEKYGNIEFEISSLTNIGTCISNNAIKNKLGKEERDKSLDLHHKALLKYEETNAQSYGALCLIHSNFVIAYSMAKNRGATIYHFEKLLESSNAAKMHNSGSSIGTLFAVSLYTMRPSLIIQSFWEVLVMIKDSLYSFFYGLLIPKSKIGLLQKLLNRVETDLKIGIGTDKYIDKYKSKVAGSNTAPPSTRRNLRY